MASYAGTFAVTYDTSSSTGALAVTFGNLVTKLTSCGLTQTADSGQVTASAIVNATGTTLVNYGYQLWQFTDALAGTNPVVIKIEYGMSNNVPVFWLTIGQGSNGSGTLTGNLSPRMFFMGNGVDGSADTTHTQTAYISGDGANASGNARISLAFCEGPTRIPGCFFNIERTVNTSGVDTTTGISIHAVLGNFNGSTNGSPVSVLSMMLPYGSVTLAGYQTTWISALNRTNASLFFGTTVGTCLVVPFNFIPYPPVRGVLLYYGSDFPLYSSNTINVYGTNHTYLALNQQANASPTNSITDYTTGIQEGSVYPPTHILFRYE